MLDVLHIGGTMVNLRTERTLMFERRMKMYIIDLTHWPVVPKEEDIIKVEFSRDGSIRCQHGQGIEMSDEYVISMREFERHGSSRRVWTTNRKLAAEVAKLVNDRRAEEDGYV